MILATITLTGIVVSAVGDAFIAPFCADEVGQGLTVFGDVGGDAVGADAGVG